VSFIGLRRNVSMALALRKENFALRRPLNDISVNIPEKYADSIINQYLSLFSVRKVINYLGESMTYLWTKISSEIC
jgi:hypothetical protein